MEHLIILVLSGILGFFTLFLCFLGECLRDFPTDDIRKGQEVCYLLIKAAMVFIAVWSFILGGSPFPLIFTGVLFFWQIGGIIPDPHLRMEIGG